MQQSETIQKVSNNKSDFISVQNRIQFFVLYSQKQSTITLMLTIDITKIQYINSTIKN
jgi:hypothetical protein